MKFKITFYTLLCIVFMCSCNTQPNSKHDQNAIVEKIGTSNDPIHLNVSIFIDLSDRISPEVHPNATMSYAERDVGYINSIIHAFKTHMLKKKIVLMNERIQLYVDPPPANHEINRMISKLKLDFNKDNITKERIDKLDSLYENSANTLYKLAIKDDNYVGSDIWGFFKTKVNDYCVSSEHRNILIILTDGYIYHKDNVFIDSGRSSFLTTKRIKDLGLNSSNWEEKMEDNNFGFVVANGNLQNLEVLILGINAYKNSPYEEDVIRKYWSNWLTDMGIKKYAIKSADLPTNLDKVIEDFILQ